MVGKRAVINSLNSKIVAPAYPPYLASLKIRFFKKSDFFESDTSLKIRFFKKSDFFESDTSLKIRFFKKIGFF
jgi:hypothetical protein